MAVFRLSTALVYAAHLPLLLSVCAQEWSIRLQDGNTPFEGRVEVLLGNHWGTIEDVNWDDEDATIVCRQLGFTAAEASLQSGVFPPADWSTPVLLSDVQCEEAASSLSECAHRPVTSHYYSPHTRDAAVRCAVDYSLRLYNQDGGHTGRLEIHQNSLWSPVCLSSSWSDKEALVACRQLGYNQLNAIGGMSSTAAVTVSALNCSGNESHIQLCPKPQPATITSTCSSGMSIQLTCAGTPLPPHPPRMTFPSCSSISLTWSSPDDQGLLVQSFSLRYRPLPHLPSATSQLLPWTNMSLLPSGTESEAVTIDGLWPLTQYQFQISAINEAGESPFSDIVTVITPAPKIGVPSPVQIGSLGQTTAGLSWTEPMSCGIDNLTYEISYSIEGRFQSSVSFLDNVSYIHQEKNSQVHYVIQGLLPYTQYAVKVRVVGYVDGGDGMYRLDNGTVGLMGRNIALSGNFSDVTLFTTNISVPSGSPQAFVALFSLVQSAVHFQWKPVSPHLANGIILGYTISCHYRENGEWQWRRVLVSNSTFSYSLENLLAATEYECSVAATNEVGQGPDSTPVLFTTPVDLSRRPSAPRNVAFAIMEPNSDKNSFFIEATWEMFMCESNFSCIQLLGYVITCQAEDSREAVRTTLWLSDFIEEEEVYENAHVPVRPFTRYDCSMSALNTYGVGQPGSKISLVTPETIPSQSPMQFYSTMIQSDSVRIHWTYNESPKAGVLGGFAIDTYQQDPESQQRKGTFIIREFLSPINNQETTTFSYLLMYLEPGVTYNVFVSAFTGAGEGPQGRIIVNTLRTVPTAVPENLFVGVSSSTAPFPISVDWSLPQSSLSNHIGFVVHCYENSTGVANELLTHNVLNEELLHSYSTNALLPDQCARSVVLYECAVAVFNERGEGQRSEPYLFNLPCNGGRGGSLSSSFLADPYYGLTFLALIILLVILLIISLVFCGVCIARYERRIKEEQHYNTVPYDEGYISMAPSGSNSSAMKQIWLRNNTHRPSSGSTTRLNMDQEDCDHYDDIPGERASKTENVYDEIPLHLTPIPPGRSNNSSMRSSPAIQHIVACPSIRSVSSCHSDKSFDLDESQVTTMTSITKSDIHTTGVTTLSTQSSEESLAKATEKENDTPKPSPFKHHSSSSGRGRKSGYVEVVTTKDGKRCIRELDRALPHVASVAKKEMDVSPPQERVRGKSVERASLQDQFHSYQNVAEIKRPKSASSARLAGVLDDKHVTHKAESSRSSMKKVTSADFQLSTVTDSEV